jgi:hypothetical protein
MADKIRDAVTKLIGDGFTSQLYVAAQATDDGLCFILSPASEYGLPASMP